MVQPAPNPPTQAELIPRPPTPPRQSDNVDIRPKYFGRIFSKDSSIRSSSNLTPDSSGESPNEASGTSRKKVGWSAWTDYKDPPILSTDGQAILDHALQPLPPSAERKPVKSILKPYNGSVVEGYSLGTNKKLSPPHTFPNLATMLESIVQQLAGKDRSSKTDAYMALSSVLKASDNVPDVRALKDKMGLLLQFIQRDLAAKTPAGTPDTVLIINSLILLSSFLHKSAIAETITVDFSSFIVDHSVKTFEDPGMSKDITKHLMFILAQQNFSPKIMNVERVKRLITALHSIENHVKGKSIVLGRLNIYRTLLRQTKSHMLANTEWIQDLFTDMLSSIKDIRTAAITFGLQSSLLLGAESKASRAVMDLFQWEGNDVKFIDYYSGRLKSMVQKKQDSSSVPQIWSIPILFLRCRPRQLEQWQFMKPWLDIIQECFNCSDQQTKLEANYAWNRLVFAVEPDEKTGPTMIKMLCQPLSSQLKRKHLQKRTSVSKARRATIGSVCNLLYYAVKPNSNLAQLDLYWDEYIVQLVGKNLIPDDIHENQEVAKQDLFDACLILTGLLDSTTPRPWKETRAVELLDLNPVETTELPALDPKWVRKSASRVFSILDSVLEKLFWQLDEEDSAVKVLWRTYIQSIVSAASKEVKVSNDTMTCVACTFNLLYKIWHKGPENLQSLPTERPRPGNFLGNFETIILTTIGGLGLFPFTEKLLSVGNQDTFTVIATPSHRPGKTRGEVKCPLHHLFLLLTHQSPNLEYDRKFLQMVRNIFSPFFNARGSSKARMELVNDLLKLLPVESMEPSRMIWRVLAEFATVATDTRDEGSAENSGSSEHPLGVDYRGVVKILEVGVDLSPDEALPGWKTLYEALVTSATIDAGDGGRAIAVIEPLAKPLLSKLPKAENFPNALGLSYCRMLLSKATYPKDRQALDAARRRLWGTASAGQKLSGFDPYTRLYEYVCRCSEMAYASFSQSQILEYSDVLVAIAALLGRCPTTILTAVLSKLQHGIACWVQDKSIKLSGRNSLSQAINSLWEKICSLIPQVRNISSLSKLLSDLEPLICCGLESKHRSIVNASIRLWNSTFGGSEERLEYPLRVKESLLRLRQIADLQLPFLPESLSSSEALVDQRQPPQFTDTQDDPGSFSVSNSLDSFLRKQRTPHLDPSPLPRLRNMTPQVIIEVARPKPTNHSREATPDPGKKNVPKWDSTPKLRHDDSQAQFEAIESSPFEDKDFDSQILTDRQKEVKERQQAEAALFPDLRSSPKLKGQSSQKKPTSSLELPLHLSPSKTRTEPMLEVERQTMPTLIQVSEYDDFIPSSPTPTRTTHEEYDVSAPPSSPPEAIVNDHFTDRMSRDDETDVPSSPPEIIEEPEHDTSTSLDPSAQVDPYAFENNRTISTFESTPDGKHDSTFQSYSAPQEFASLGNNSKLLSAEPDISLASSDAEQNKVAETGVVCPSTPPAVLRAGTPATEPTPKTPHDVFVDALSSPALSDEPAPNEDVFEDAFSSPRLTIKKQLLKQDSTPISDLDESSMLRLVTRFDRDSARHLRDQERSNPDQRLPGPVAGASQSAIASSGAPEGPKETSIHLHREAQGDGSPVLCSPELVEPTFQSSVPETPAVDSISAESCADEEEIDLEDTIIVDIPENFWAAAEKAAPAMKRVSPRKRSSARLHQSQKRKHDDFAKDECDLLHGANIKIEGDSPKRGSPKRRRGRYSKGTETIAEPELTESFASVDLDVPMVSSEDIGSTAEVLTSSLKLPKQEDKVPPIHIGGDEFRTEENISSSAPIQEGTHTSGTDLVVPQVIDDNLLLANSSSGPMTESCRNDESALGEISMDATSSSEQATGMLYLSEDSQVAQSSQVEVTTAQSMRDKLRSLIGELGSAALSREEVSAFEDLFMDAKEQLYGAGRRGRRRPES